MIKLNTILTHRGFKQINANYWVHVKKKIEIWRKNKKICITTYLDTARTKIDTCRVFKKVPSHSLIYVTVKPAYTEIGYFDDASLIRNELAQICKFDKEVK